MISFEKRFQQCLVDYAVYNAAPVPDSDATIRVGLDAMSRLVATKQELVHCAKKVHAAFAMYHGICMARDKVTQETDSVAVLPGVLAEIASVEKLEAPPPRTKRPPPRPDECLSSCKKRRERIRRASAASSGSNPPGSIGGAETKRDADGAAGEADDVGGSMEDLNIESDVDDGVSETKGDADETAAPVPDPPKTTGTTTEGGSATTVPKRKTITVGGAKPATGGSKP